MSSKQNIWGTKVETSITETVELYIAFTAVDGVQGIEACEAAEKHFEGAGMADEEWASL